MKVFSAKEKIKEILGTQGGVLHFCGVGGVSMYSLFRLSEALGYRVTGSDRQRGKYTDILINEGKSVNIGHSEKNVIGKALVVRTLAVGDDNEEIKCALKRGIPTVTRAEYLGALMECYKERIGISGTHGKSTTTAMLREIFTKALKNPTTLCGADMSGINSPVEIGERDHLIYEACEYKNSYHFFSPTLSVFTNLELDHTDYFKSMAEIEESFLRAMDISEICILNRDDENLRKLIPRVKKTVLTYGQGADSDFKISVLSGNSGKYSFSLDYKGKRVCVKLSVPGKFNAYNAAAAASVALLCGIHEKAIENALSSFQAPGRRLEYLCTYKGARVYYDYAHHPTEIRETIACLREMYSGKITVIFKPHTYSRTVALLSEFIGALSLADKVLLLEIDPIREDRIEGISSELIAEKIGKKALSISEGDIPLSIPGDEEVIVIMGAAPMDSVRGMMNER